MRTSTIPVGFERSFCYSEHGTVLRAHKVTDNAVSTAFLTRNSTVDSCGLTYACWLYQPLTRRRTFFAARTWLMLQPTKINGMRIGIWVEDDAGLRHVSLSPKTSVYTTLWRSQNLKLRQKWFYLLLMNPTAMRSFTGNYRNMFGVHGTTVSAGEIIIKIIIIIKNRLK